MRPLERHLGQFLLSSAQETLPRINALLDDAQWICIATGYARTSGLDLLAPRFSELVRAGRVWILSSDRPEQLSAEFVSRMSALHPDALRVLPNQPRLMHAKTWIFQPSSPSHHWVLTGSWNLTRSGLTRNDDLGAWLVADSQSAGVAELRTWFRERWDAARSPPPEQFHSERLVGDDDDDSLAIAKRIQDAERPQAALAPAVVVSATAMLIPRPSMSVAAAMTPSEPAPRTPAPFNYTASRFAALARCLENDAVLVSRTNAAFEFRLRDPDSVWTLDMRAGRASVRSSSSPDADCVFEMRDADFQALCDGAAGREELWFAGRMTIARNVMRAAALDVRAMIAATEREAKTRPVDEDDVVVPVARAPLPPLSSPTLAPFQKEALEAIRVHHRAQENDFVALLTLPTGGGKTRVAVWWLLEDIVAKGGRVVWIAHRQELLEQARATFEEHRGLLRDRVPLRISYITHDSKDPSGNVVLASTMTLLNNTDLIRGGTNSVAVNGICFDEAHHATATETKRMLLALRKRQSVPLLGLTATPYRMDSGETTFAHDFFDARVAYRITFGELVASGFLATPQWHYLTRPEGSRKLKLSSADIADVRARNDFTAAVLKQVAGDHEWNAAIVDQWQRGSYGQTIVFASNIDHIAELRRAFKRRADVDAVSISYDMDGDERMRALEAFASRRARVLINVAILTEGTDIENVETVVMARPTLSRILYRQMIGRAARRGRDRSKTHFRILDCVQNSLFHHDTDLHLAGDEVRRELSGA